MLTYIRYDDCIAFCHLVQFFHYIRTCQNIFFVFQRIFLFHCINLTEPVSMIFWLYHSQQTLQALLQITHYADINQDVFVDLCRINIQLDNLRIFCKVLCISRYTVAESAAAYNQKITLCHTEVGCFCSMHTKHTCIQRIFTRESTFSHQSITDRSLNLMSQFKNFFGCVRSNCTASYENIWFLCLGNECCCLF